MGISYATNTDPNRWPARDSAFLIHFLADSADQGSETGYDSEPLSDESDLLCWETFHTLRNTGVDLPKTFPTELNIDYEESPDNLWDLIDENPYSSLILRDLSIFH
jgi:hypothetical protein